MVEVLVGQIGLAYRRLGYGLMVFLFSVCVNADISKVKLGVYELPPHLINENKKLSGPVIDYLNNQVRPHLGKVELEVVSLPFARLMEYLKKGRIDVAFMVSKTPERELLYDYSEREVFQTQSVLIFNPEKQIENLTSSQQLAGMVIGHTQGSVVVKFIENSKAKVEFLAGEDTLLRNLKKLELKRLDAVFAPTSSHAEYILNANNYSSKFVVKVIPETELNLYIVFRKNLDGEVKNLFSSDKSPAKSYMKYLLKYKKVNAK